jgi:selenoprotein W-related protein
MASEWKVLVDIVYCVAWKHHATATWVANEFFSTFSGDVAVSLTPGANGRFEVYMDGEKIFDRKEEGNIYPDLSVVRRLKKVVQEKLAAMPAAAD